jgi:hypothetical protein
MAVLVAYYPKIVSAVLGTLPKAFPACGSRIAGPFADFGMDGGPPTARASSTSQSRRDDEFETTGIKASR